LKNIFNPVFLKDVIILGSCPFLKYFSSPSFFTLAFDKLLVDTDLSSFSDQVHRGVASVLFFLQRFRSGGFFCIWFFVFLGHTWDFTDKS
jgi:hypothetical protein